MFIPRSRNPIIIRDIAFQNLSPEDRRVLSAPTQLRASGTIVVPEDRSARDVAAMLREQLANRVIVLEKGSKNVFGALAPAWASEQIRLNLDLHGDFHEQIAQWEDLEHEQARLFHHEWLRYDGHPPLYYCNCHNRSEVRRHDPSTCYV